MGYKADHNLGNPDAEKGMHTRFHRTLYGVSSVSARLEVTDLIPLKDKHTTTSAKGLDPLSYEFGAGNGLRVIFARSLSLGSIPSRSTKLRPIDEVVSYRIVYPRLRVRFSHGSPKYGLLVQW